MLWSRPPRQLAQFAVSLSRYSALLQQQSRKSSQNLPHLPVPSLKTTRDRYVASSTPILDSAQLADTISVWSSFLADSSDGGAPALQKALERRAATEENWLSKWWTEQAYLKGDLSLPISVNPGMSVTDLTFTSTFDWIRAMARIIVAALQFRSKILNGLIPTDLLGGVELDMSQYQGIFDTCRVPGPAASDCDVLKFMTEQPSRHIVVFHKGCPYRVTVAGPDGELYGVKDLETSLTAIVKAEGPFVDADDLPVESQSGLGLLTTLPRSSWRSLHENATPSDKNTIATIQSAAFVLCADDAVSGEPRAAALAANYIHGGPANSNNRWFDKTLQIIVTADGGVGICYEHTLAEGPPIAALIDHLNLSLATPLRRSSVMVLISRDMALLPVSSSFQAEIAAAGRDFFKRTSDLDVFALNFAEFGKRLIKTFRLSPDAFCQIAMQLTFYTLHDESPSTYETGSTRRFARGRTDTIRTCSVESDLFCRAAIEKCPPNELAALLYESVGAHRRYTADAVSGQAMDRHLLGLRMAASSKGLPTPALFSHVSYQKLFHLRLSTSQVSASGECVMGFGPAVEDGYGVCYNVLDERLVFCITSWRSGDTQSSQAFADTLSESLVFLASLVGEKSKL